VEAIGIARGREIASRADIVLLVTESGKAFEDVSVQGQRVLVENKIDLFGLEPGIDREGIAISVRVSAQTGAGLDLLRVVLLEAGGWAQAEEEGVFMARERHLQALREADKRLEAAAVIGVAREELFAEELRYAQDALAAVSGRITSDDLLGEIFSRFCIGK